MDFVPVATVVLDQCRNRKSLNVTLMAVACLADGYGMNARNVR